MANQIKNISLIFSENPVGRAYLYLFIKKNLISNEIIYLNQKTIFNNFFLKLNHNIVFRNLPVAVEVYLYIILKVSIVSYIYSAGINLFDILSLKGILLLFIESR